MPTIPQIIATLQGMAALNPTEGPSPILASPHADVVNRLNAIQTLLTEALQDLSSIRVVASGTTAVPAVTTVTLTTFVRGAGERLSLLLFGTEHIAGVQYNEGGSIQSADGVAAWFEETATMNEVNVRARNFNATNARTIDWAVQGQTP
jgi:hypothetical protein